jgi:hypothetical protein
MSTNSIQIAPQIIRSTNNNNNNNNNNQRKENCPSNDSSLRVTDGQNTVIILDEEAHVVVECLKGLMLMHGATHQRKRCAVAIDGDLDMHELVNVHRENQKRITSCALANHETRSIGLSQHLFGIGAIVDI